MNITHAAVEWYEEYSNSPTLYIEVDGFLPSVEDYRYEQRGSCYFGQHESGCCSFFSYTSPGEGYGGREFRLTMIDGSQQVLKGPWSGNELSMAAAGFPMTYQCRAKHRCNWGDGWSSSGGVHLLEPMWRAAIERFCPDAHLVRAECAAGSPDMSGEQNHAIGHGLPPRGPVLSTFLIARKGMTFAQSQAFKRAKYISRLTHEVRDEPVRYSYQKSGVEQRLSHATYVNALIAEHSLGQWIQPFDLGCLPPLLPARPPEPAYSGYDPEGESQYN